MHNECTLYGPQNESCWVELNVHAHLLSGLVSSQPGVLVNPQDATALLCFLPVPPGTWRYTILPLTLETQFSIAVIATSAIKVLYVKWHVTCMLRVGHPWSIQHNFIFQPPAPNWKTYICTLGIVPVQLRLDLSVWKSPAINGMYALVSNIQKYFLNALIPAVS